MEPVDDKQRIAELEAAVVEQRRQIEELNKKRQQDWESAEWDRKFDEGWRIAQARGTTYAQYCGDFT